MFALTVAASAGARVAPTAGESTHLIPQAPVTGAPPARPICYDPTDVEQRP